jgi:HPt (histidine-containing phosphotransfer) domain-containing protein
MHEDSPQLDPQALQRLEQLGGTAFVIKMIDLFNSYAGEKVAAARQACAAGALAGVEKAVHPIKSSAGNVGACRVQALAEQLEQSARQGQANAVEGLLRELELAFTAARDALEQQKQTLLNRTP